MIFVGSTGGRCTASSTATSRPSARDEHVTPALDGDGRPVEQDPPQLGHVGDRSCARGSVAVADLVVVLEHDLRAGVEDVVARRLRGVLDLVLAVWDHQSPLSVMYAPSTGTNFSERSGPGVDHGPTWLPRVVVDDVADGADLHVVVVQHRVTGEVARSLRLSDVISERRHIDHLLVLVARLASAYPVGGSSHVRHVRGGLQCGRDATAIPRRTSPPRPAALTLDQKVALLAGVDTWHTASFDEPPVPAIRMSDGPAGVRGTSWSGPASASFPCGTALGATWDPALVGEVGRALGREAHSKSAHVLLAPTVNLHRTPIGGRNFECYSEDPVLTAASPWPTSRACSTSASPRCIKHFVGNDTEFERMTISSEIDERTLRELYLVPFERAVSAPACARS